MVKKIWRPLSFNLSKKDGRYLKWSKVTETESRVVVAGGWKEGDGEFMFNGFRGSVMQNEKHSGDDDDGDGCTKT